MRVREPSSCTERNTQLTFDEAARVGVRGEDDASNAWIERQPTGCPVQSGTAPTAAPYHTVCRGRTATQPWPEGGTMGDKGGKKDKEKNKQQQERKQQEQKQSKEKARSAGPLAKPSA